MNSDRLVRPRLSFTQVPNDLICSSDLSSMSKSVYCYLISRPDDWKFYTKEIAKNMKESLNTVKKALNELIEFGWIAKEQIRHQGRFSHSVFTLFYEVSTVNQNTVNGNTVNHKTVNRNLVTTNTDTTNTKKTNTYFLSSKEDKKLLTEIMKFRKDFINNYNFDGFIAFGLSEKEYDYLEFSCDSNAMIIVKETNERITKELALEVWKFLYKDYQTEKPFNASSYLSMTHKKVLQIEHKKDC